MESKTKEALIASLLKISIEKKSDKNRIVKNMQYYADMCVNTWHKTCPTYGEAWQWVVEPTTSLVEKFNDAKLTLDEKREIISEAGRMALATIYDKPVLF